MEPRNEQRRNKDNGMNAWMNQEMEWNWKQNGGMNHKGGGGGGGGEWNGME